MCAETPLARAIAIRGVMSPCFSVSWTCGKRITEACTPRSKSAIAVTSDTRGRDGDESGGAPLGHSDSGADNERTAGTLEHGADGFDRTFVEFAAFRKLRPVVPESDVKDGIGGSGAATEAFQVLQIAAMDFSASCDQRLGARIAACKTEHLVTCADQFRDNPGTDESCCTCHENTHRDLLYFL